MKKERYPWQKSKGRKENRFVRNRILIVCEGAKTEVNYFKKFPDSSLTRPAGRRESLLSVISPAGKQIEACIKKAFHIFPVSLQRLFHMFRKDFCFLILHSGESPHSHKRNKIFVAHFFFIKVMEIAFGGEFSSVIIHIFPKSR